MERMEKKDEICFRLKKRLEAKRWRAVKSAYDVFIIKIKVVKRL